MRGICAIAQAGKRAGAQRRDGGQLYQPWHSGKDLGRRFGGSRVYHEQSLKLNQELGRKEGMAKNYTNLGILADTRGEIWLRRGRFGRKAWDLYAEIGMPHMVEKAYQKSLRWFRRLGALPCVPAIVERCTGSKRCGHNWRCNFALPGIIGKGNAGSALSL